MEGSLIHFLTQAAPLLFEGAVELLTIFGISMLPIVELRGAIPIGLGLGLSPLSVFMVSVIGNLVPVPFIILFVRRVFHFLASRIEFAKRLYDLEKRTLNKAGLIYKYSFWGLALFVAIPLPGTGAWTGALIAALIDLRLKYAFPAIALGVLIAGGIVTAAASGVISVFKIFLP